MCLGGGLQQDSLKTRIDAILHKYHAVHVTIQACQVHQVSGHWIACLYVKACRAWTPGPSQMHGFLTRFLSSHLYINCASNHTPPSPETVSM